MTDKSAKMSIFKPVYIDERVMLTPTEYEDAYEDINKYLTNKLRKSLEGQCCTHGYVRPGSTRIVARSMGAAEHGRFTGDFIFHCKVGIDCFLPYANQELDCRILIVNKLGCYALVMERGRTIEAMRILIPRDLHLGNDEFEALQAGQGIRVSVLRSRFQSNDAFIQSVGMYKGRMPSLDEKKEGQAPTDAFISGVPVATAVTEELDEEEKEAEDAAVVPVAPATAAALMT